jgi:hypothetical protein
MSTEVTLKRIGFKAGPAAQPDPVAEIVLMCKDPNEVLHLARYVSKAVLVDVAPIQEELPLEEPTSNGTVLPSAGRRRRGSTANVTDDE